MLLFSSAAVFEAATRLADSGSEGYISCTAVFEARHSGSGCCSCSNSAALLEMIPTFQGTSCGTGQTGTGATSYSRTEKRVLRVRAAAETVTARHAPRGVVHSATGQCVPTSGHAEKTETSNNQESFDISISRHIQIYKIEILNSV